MKINYRYIQNLALLLFLFSLNFEVYDPLSTGGSFSIAKLTGYLYLASVLPRLKAFLELKGLIKYLAYLAVFFLLLSVMNAIYANALFSEVVDRTILQNIVLFWIMVNHERQESGILEKGFLAFAMGSVALAVLFNAGVGIGYAGERMTIFGDNQNTVGMRMCISSTILAVNVIQNRLELGRIRYLLLLPIPLMIQLMTATQSRVSIVAFVMTFLLGVLLFRTSRLWIKLVTLVGGLAILGGIVLIVLSMEGVRIRLLQAVVEGDLSGRKDIWASIIPFIAEHPLFGSGRTGYNYYIQSLLGEVKSPHNVILEVWAYVGLAGLFAYLNFYIRSVAVSIRVVRASGMLLPILLMVPIAGLLLSGQLLDVKIAWVVFAYVASCTVVDQDELPDWEYVQLPEVPEEL